MSIIGNENDRDERREKLNRERDALVQFLKGSGGETEVSTAAKALNWNVNRPTTLAGVFPMYLVTRTQFSKKRRRNYIGLHRHILAHVA